MGTNGRQEAADRSPRVFLSPAPQPRGSHASPRTPDFLSSVFVWFLHLLVT